MADEKTTAVEPAPVEQETTLERDRYEQPRERENADHMDAGQKQAARVNEEQREFQERRA